MTSEGQRLLAPAIMSRINGLLRFLDRELSLLERQVESQGIDSVLYREVNDLSLKRRDRFRAGVDETRNMIARMKADLGLQIEVKSMNQLVWSRCSSLQVDIMDLETKRLRGYGDPPEWLYAYLDPRVAELSAVLEKIAKDVA